MPTPSYYLGKSGKLQPVHIIEDFDLSYHRGTALVYIVRAGKKPGEPELKDLKKARAHLDMAIAEAERREAEGQKPQISFRSRFKCTECGSFTPGVKSDLTKACSAANRRQCPIIEARDPAEVGLVCRADYPGESACTHHGGMSLCACWPDDSTPVRGFPAR